MNLETDPKVVEKLAKEREDEHWRFPSFLKGSDLEIEEVDAIMHKHNEEVSKFPLIYYRNSVITYFPHT